MRDTKTETEDDQLISRLPHINFELGNLTTSIGDINFKGSILLALSPCQFPQPNLSEMAEMDLLVHNWLIYYGIQSEQESRGYVQFQQPYVTGSVFLAPEANICGPGMIIFYLILAWIWRMEDHLEKYFQDEVSYLAYRKPAEMMRDVSVAILRGQKYKNIQDLPELDFPQYLELARALFDIHERLIQEIEDYNTASYYFTKYFERYFNGAISIHECRHDFSETTFRFFREYEAGAQLTAEIISLISGIRLEKTTRQNLLFKRFKLAYGPAFTYTNDLFGIKNDIKAKEYCNLILFKSGGPNKLTNLLANFKEVEKQINLGVMETRQVASLLRKSFGSDKSVLAYVRMIELYLDGQIYFYKHGSLRYGSVKVHIVE